MGLFSKKCEYYRTKIEEGKEMRKNVKEKTYGGWQFVPALNCLISLSSM